jgi:hypothetical protein
LAGGATRLVLAAVSAIPLKLLLGSAHETDKIVREASFTLGDGQVRA